jgi:ketosteroid isomerase-like protein
MVAADGAVRGGSMPRRVPAITLAAVLLACLASSASIEDELAEVERAFAGSMANRDLAAFESFLADEAVFIGEEGPLRGRAAVVGAWTAYFEGEAAPFSWEPETVVVLESGTLGLTTGPVYAPGGRRVGTFHSTWRRTDSGWEIVLDVGCPWAAPPEN